jgi:hypothetical protein
MSTGYYERGCPPRNVLIPAGTKVNYSLDINTSHKFDDGISFNVCASHRMDCTFDEAIAKLGFKRT